jgi:carrier protein
LAFRTMAYLVTPIFNVLVTNTTYPVTYTKTLMQLGHEPLAAFRGKSYGYFGAEVSRVPNGFKYMKHIVRVDGVLGLTRGLGSRVISDIVFRLVQDRTNTMLLDHSGTENERLNKKDGEEDLSDVAYECALESCSKLAAVVISQPFYVVSVRAMAQFIGREKIYGLPFVSSFQDIFQHDGVLGFFAGLVPRALCEILNLWIGKMIYYFACKYMFDKDSPHEIQNMREYARICSPVMTSFITYPLNLTANIMAVNGSSLVAGNFPISPVYRNWVDCLRHLTQTNATKRGSGFFIRLI